MYINAIMINKCYYINEAEHIAHDTNRKVFQGTLEIKQLYRE